MIKIKKSTSISEVLITLSIIGIIASITIPNLVKNYQKSISISGLKKGYSTFLTAFNKAENEYGKASGWDYLPIDKNGKCECVGYSEEECVNSFMEKYFLPYLKIVEYKKREEKATQIKDLSGKNAQLFFSKDRKYYYLEDGSNFSIYINQDNCNFSYIFYDINGDKKPNTLGKDIFLFDIGRSHNYHLQMEKRWYGNTYLKSNEMRNYIKKNCNDITNTSGYYNSFTCGALIQYDGWKISKDYPW